MINISLNYRFMVILTTLKDGREFFDIGMECRELPMLDLPTSLKTVLGLITKLEAVLESHLTEHHWGSDLYEIVSQKEVSIIHHHYGDEGLNLKDDIEMKVSTAVLLKIVKEWALFLEAVPKNWFGNRL